MKRQELISAFISSYLVSIASKSFVALPTYLQEVIRCNFRILLPLYKFFPSRLVRKKRYLPTHHDYISVIKKQMNNFYHF